MWLKSNPAVFLCLDSFLCCSLPYMSEQNYVRFRTIWALIFVVHGLYDQYTSIFIDEPSQSIWYYFYLTHQSRLVQSLGQLTEWMCARSFFKGEIPSAWISKTTMLCFVAGQPIPLLLGESPFLSQIALCCLISVCHAEEVTQPLE